MRRSSTGTAAASACLLAAATCLPALPAQAHAIAGARVFPVTLTLDDPGVADEATLPQLTYQRAGADGGPGPVQAVNFGFEYDKRITKDFGFVLNDGFDLAKVEHGKTSLGFEDLVVTAKYQAYVNAPHELIISLGVIRELGRTGTMHTGADEYGSTSPTLYFGKGLGDLPSGALRPLAVTGELSYMVADRELKSIAGPPPLQPLAGIGAAGIAQFNNGYSNRWSGGLSVQYSIPYLDSQVHDTGMAAFFRHLVPVVEVAWSSPAASPSNQGTQVTVAPGVIWIVRSCQVGVEALVPGNRASGTSVGGILQVHLFLDDLLPRSLGRPLAEW